MLPIQFVKLNKDSLKLRILYKRNMSWYRHQPDILTLTLTKVSSALILMLSSKSSIFIIHMASTQRQVEILPQTDFWGSKFPQNIVIRDQLKNIRYLYTM